MSAALALPVPGESVGRRGGGGVRRRRRRVDVTGRAPSVATLKTEQRDRDYPPELAVFDQARWPGGSKKAWWLARAHAAPTRLDALK